MLQGVKQWLGQVSATRHLAPALSSSTIRSSVVIPRVSQDYAPNLAETFPTRFLAITLERPQTPGLASAKLLAARRVSMSLLAVSSTSMERVQGRGRTRRTRPHPGAHSSLWLNNFETFAFHPSKTNTTAHIAETDPKLLSFLDSNQNATTKRA